MTLQRPMFPLSAADRARPQLSSTNDRATADNPANLQSIDVPPKPQKRPAKRRASRRRKGSYHPVNITLEDFFRAHHMLPPVESGEPERWTATDLMRGAHLHPSDRALRPAPFPALAALVQLRDAAAAEIDRLLAFLDATESDCDLEGLHDALEECEPDDAENEDGGDDEPSLGFLQRNPSGYCVSWCSDDDGIARDSIGSQEDLCDGLGDDREDEHDGTEPDVEDEPSLAATNAMNQEHAWAIDSLHNITDGEIDPAEMGIGDIDGWIEQGGDLRGGSQFRIYG